MRSSFWSSPDLRPGIWALLVVAVWTNISEIWRYFVVVMPQTRLELSVLPNVAPMNLAVFLSWGVWDMILVCVYVGSYWLVSGRLGHSVTSALISGAMTWLGFFVLFWLALFNMNLASSGLAVKAVALALPETLIAALIAFWCFQYLQARPD